MSLNGYDYLPEAWLNILVFIHVVSAIVGIGPAFFMHVLFRKGQNYGQLRSSLGMAKVLEKFPKILGSLAVVTGLLLAWLGDYGFKQFWIYGSIILYILIQILVVGFMAPIAAKVAARVMALSGPADQPLPQDIADDVKKADSLNYIVTVLGILLFTLMFFKPTL